MLYALDVGSQRDQELAVDLRDVEGSGRVGRREQSDARGRERFVRRVAVRPKGVLLFTLRRAQRVLKGARRHFGQITRKVRLEDGLIELGIILEIGSQRGDAIVRRHKVARDRQPGRARGQPTGEAAAQRVALPQEADAEIRRRYDLAPTLPRGHACKVDDVVRIPGGVADVPTRIAEYVALEPENHLIRRRVAGAAALPHEIEKPVDTDVVVRSGTAREQHLDLRRERKGLRLRAAARRRAVELIGATGPIRSPRSDAVGFKRRRVDVGAVRDDGVVLGQTRGRNSE